MKPTPKTIYEDDKFEKAGPYLCMAPIVGWFMWCLPDMMDWFARF